MTSVQNSSYFSLVIRSVASAYLVLAGFRLLSLLASLPPNHHEHPSLGALDLHTRKARKKGRKENLHSSEWRNKERRLLSLLESAHELKFFPLFKSPLKFACTFTSVEFFVGTLRQRLLVEIRLLRNVGSRRELAGKVETGLDCIDSSSDLDGLLPN